MSICFLHSSVLKFRPMVDRRLSYFAPSTKRIMLTNVIVLFKWMLNQNFVWTFEKKKISYGFTSTIYDEVITGQIGPSIFYY